MLKNIQEISLQKERYTQKLKTIEKQKEEILHFPTYLRISCCEHLSIVKIKSFKPYKCSIGTERSWQAKPNH